LSRDQIKYIIITPDNTLFREISDKQGLGFQERNLYKYSEDILAEKSARLH
jgi:hypothetical protein